MTKSLLPLIRFFSLADGLSFVVLLYFAIYEKRILGNDEAIQIPGRIHGGIFTVLFILVVLKIIITKWDLKRAGLIMVAALIPFAPFFLEPSLKKEQNRS